MQKNARATEVSVCCFFLIFLPEVCESKMRHFGIRHCLKVVVSLTYKKYQAIVRNICSKVHFLWMYSCYFKSQLTAYVVFFLINFCTWFIHSFIHSTITRDLNFYLPTLTILNWRSRHIFLSKLTGIPKMLSVILKEKITSTISKHRHIERQSVLASKRKQSMKS